MVHRHEDAVRERIRSLSGERFLPRLWERDPTLWKKEPSVADRIRGRLGWLAAPEAIRRELPRLEALSGSLRREGFAHLVVLGMGGSSLCPEVLKSTFPPRNGWPRLWVLDSTDPGAIRRLESAVEIRRSCFVVSSKSGTTTETLCFHRHFAARLKQAGLAEPGRHFVGITDPGTPLEALGRREGFREIFLSPADVGGRYSALTYFGMVPAALAGVDVGTLLERAARMAAAHGPDVPPEAAPGLVLGAVLGEMAVAGRDKVTLVASSGVESFGLWAEQLLAESTGKEGKGLIPVAGEPLGEPDQYGKDRIFVALTLSGEEPGPAAGLKRLEDAGHPVVVLELADPLDLGAEFYRWEVATVAAGAILGINPFDEPNVQESKDNTQALLGAFRSSGRLPEEEPAGRDGGLLLFTDEPGMSKPPEILRRFLSGIAAENYFGIQAYLAPEPVSESLLGRIRRAVRDRLRVATTLGFGPRYLHSTGQLHKGGPDTGVFLQITAEDREELPIPGEPYGFSILKRAQALGDSRALRARGRPLLRVHLTDPGSDLEKLAQLVERTLASS